MPQSLFTPLEFARGAPMRNRFALAPLTNMQSHADGTVSEDERQWLVARARGGCALVTTCAAQVQPVGQGFPGQIALYSDIHLHGLEALASGIKQAGPLAWTQLHHAGRRAEKALTGRLVSASDDPETGAEGMSEGEVAACIEAFVDAAIRCERAGFDGVEIHGAHGYLLAQFLSAETNRREDAYGGSPEARARIVREIIAGIRSVCGPDFQVGLRLSAERYGIDLGETIELVRALCAEDQLDAIDLSLWDHAKMPEDPSRQDRSLLSWFKDLPRGRTRLSCAGKIGDAATLVAVAAEGMDLIKLGRAAILHHDFVNRLRDDPAFVPVSPPVTRDYLASQFVGPAFIDYLSTMGMVKA